MGRRTPCCDKKHTTSGAWSKEEDERLIRYIKFHGEGCWSTLPRAAGLMRCGKSARLRWINYLRPGLKRGNFTEEEDEQIINLHKLHGNRWSLIASRLPGRTDNEIKNYWNTHLKRMLYIKGIDPKTHKPLKAFPTAAEAATTTTAPLTNTSAAAPVVTTDNNNNNTNKDSSVSFSSSNNNNTNSSKIQLFNACDNTKIGTELSAGEGSNSSSNRSSGVTTEEAYPELNLELSLGLPSHQPQVSSMNPIDWLKQENRGQKGNLCLYCSLGFLANKACGCKGKAKVATTTVAAAAPAPTRMCIDFTDPCMNMNH